MSVLAASARPVAAGFALPVFLAERKHKIAIRSHKNFLSVKPSEIFSPATEKFLSPENFRVNKISVSPKEKISAGEKKIRIHEKNIFPPAKKFPPAENFLFVRILKETSRSNEKKFSLNLSKISHRSSKIISADFVQVCLTRKSFQAQILNSRYDVAPCPL